MYVAYAYTYIWIWDVLNQNIKPELSSARSRSAQNQRFCCDNVNVS